VVLCGQHAPYSPHYDLIEDWYGDVASYATHFRKHPAAANPTTRPLTNDWNGCRLAITLNSSVAVDTVMAGIPTITMDEGSMAWDVTGHSPDDVKTPDRRAWIRRLAWTQWHHQEINDGEPIRHLFEDI
jgi:hypothetical protein